MKTIETQNIEYTRIQQTEKLEMAIGGLANEMVLLHMDIKNLNRTIKEANEKNDNMQKWFLYLAIAGTCLALSGVIQAWDILARGIGQ
jgi:hypothetical protein